MNGDSRGPGETGRGMEELYPILVESIRDYAIFVLDTEGHVASWNAGAERIKGYTRDEVLGEHYRIFYPLEARESRDPEAQLEVAAREGRFEGEGWRCRSDGSRFWARVVLTALFEGDRLVGFGKVTADRTAEREARDTLLRRDRQLEEAQEIAHLGSWEYDPETGEIAWSAELYRIFGLDPGEALSYDRYLSLLHPEDRARVEAKVARSLEREVPYVHEHRIIRPSQEPRWVQSRGEVMREKTGAGLRLVGTTLDITELKEAEEKSRRLAAERAAREEAERTAQRMGFLAEASALLSASLEYRETLATVAWLAVPSFADWCAVDMVDPDGSLQRLAVAHLDPERVELAEELHRRYPPDPDAGSGVSHVIRSGEPELNTEIDDRALRQAAADERHLAMLRELGLVSSIIVPIRIRDRTLGALTFVHAESGHHYTRDDLIVARELAGRAGLAIENAQLHTAERDARESAERARDRTTRLQSITGGLSEAVTPQAVAEVVVDEGVAALEADSGSLVLTRGDGSLEMVRSVGVPPEVVERYGRFDGDALLPLAEAIRTGTLIVVEDLAARQGDYPELQAIQEQIGTRALVSVPLRSGEGIIGSLSFGYRDQRPFTDDDQRFLMALGRQCAQALERAWLYETEHMAREVAEAASRSKSQFVAMMSHELRTPLSAIIGYQELLSEEIAGPVNDEQREQLMRIRASASHLRDLINQILSLSRIEAGKEEVEWEEVDAAALAAEVAALMEPDSESKGLALKVELPDEEVRMETDPGKVRQILLNLMSNAIKFTAEGRVDVGLDHRPDQVRIWVRDTGVGIGPEDRERIFQVFTQADQSMTRSVGGSGLGLAVSRRLARLLGGELELETEPGSGSTFTLRLPRTRS